MSRRVSYVASASDRAISSQIDREAVKRMRDQGHCVALCNAWLRDGICADAVAQTLAEYQGFCRAVQP